MWLPNHCITAQLQQTTTTATLSYTLTFKFFSVRLAPTAPLHHHCTIAPLHHCSQQPPLHTANTTLCAFYGGIYCISLLCTQESGCLVAPSPTPNNTHVFQKIESQATNATSWNYVRIVKWMTHEWVAFIRDDTWMRCFHKRCIHTMYQWSVIWIWRIQRHQSNAAIKHNTM